MINNIIKRIIAGITLLSCFTLITGCFDKKTTKKVYDITIIEPDQSTKKVQVEAGEVFYYDYPENNNIFLGCYSIGNTEYKDFAFVDYNGKSVVWEESYPRRIYSHYIDLPINYEKSSTEQIDINIGSKIFSFSLEEGLKNYFNKNADKRYVVEFSFSHYEEKTTIFGIGASNWMNAEMFVGTKSNVKFSYLDSKGNQLESNTEYKKESKIFTDVKGSELALGEIGINFIRPTMNASSNPGKYRGFELKIYEGEENIDFSNKYIEKVGDISLNVTNSSMTKNIEINDIYKQACNNYNSNEVKITINYSNYGAKRDVFSNWSVLDIRVKKSDGTKLYEKKNIGLEHNKDFVTDTQIVTLAKEEFLSANMIELHFWYELPGLMSGNQSGMWYYIKDIEVIIEFC